MKAVTGCKGIAVCISTCVLFLVKFDQAHNAYFLILVKCGTRNLYLMLVSICEFKKFGTVRAVLL